MIKYTDKKEKQVEVKRGDYVKIKENFYVIHEAIEKFLIINIDTGKKYYHRAMSKEELQGKLSEDGIDVIDNKDVEITIAL